MFRILDKSHDDVIGIEADGVIDMEELLQAERVFEDVIARHGRVSWLCVWKGAKPENLGVFYADMMWLLKHIKKFDRMAIVGDTWWKSLLVSADGLVFGEKYFDISRLDDAWNYIEGR